jgi:outer membrane protein TolC
MKRFISLALAFFAFAMPAAAQQPTAAEAARQDTVIKEAMRTYQQGLSELKESFTTTVQPGASNQLRELRLEEAVSLALEKNLDIQVAKLEPQSVDFLVAGFKNTYLPVLSSTVGQRENYQLPTRTLTGGTRVNQGTLTYNAAIAQTLSRFGSNYTVQWSNTKVNSSDLLANYNPLFTTGLLASFTQPLMRGFKLDNTRQQLEINLINREMSEESARATVSQTVANVRNAYWDLVFAQNSVEVAQRATELADKLVEDNQARVEVGTLAPLDIVQAQAEAATRRQNLAAAEAAAQTAEIALKRFIVSGTDDPLWRQTLRPVDLPSLQAPPADVEGAIRTALAQRTDVLNTRKNLDVNDVNIRYYRNQALPDLDLNASYGAQGIGGTFFRREGSGIESKVVGTIPGGFLDALGVLRHQEYPNWNFSVTMSYPLLGSQADAQLARARLQRNQSLTRLRALEVLIAAEVTNAALTIQSNLKRVEAATAARELAQKRLEAEQSKFDVGMTTNFFVVQAQRDLRDAFNTELRALADYRKSLVNYERAQQAPAGGGGGNFGGQQQQQQ